MKKRNVFDKNILNFALSQAGCSAAWLARLTGGQEVESSNLSTPTRKSDSYEIKK